MSTYITQSDYNRYTRLPRLQQIIDEDISILNECEEDAIVIVKDALFSRYDVAAIFALTGAARHRQVVRWIMHLAIYYVYERIPDKLVPDRIIKHYDETIDTLKEISDAKKSVDLPKLEDTESLPLTKFRYGGPAARSH